MIDPSLFKAEFKAMGSACEMVISASSEAEAKRCIDLVVGEINRIEKKYSRYLPDSVISQINSSAGRNWTECDNETNSLLDYADKLFHLSDGMFDITSGIFRKIWNFSSPKVPSLQEINAILDLVGWLKVGRDENAVKLEDVGMELDFGGFGKEYAVDRAVTLLVENNIKCGYVNLGGDLRVVGPKPNGDPWKMAILNPEKPEESIASIPIHFGALATSGDYEKFFDLNGKRYCHVISPVTGFPVTYWKSISIFAPLSITAGTYSTIAMLKEEYALDWLETSGLAYLAIDHSGKLHKKTI